MLNRNTLRRPLPAIAVGVLAVAVIGGGTATAADFVTSRDIKDDSVRSVDVRDGSLRVKDLTDRAVHTLQKAGAAGAAGATGPQGPKGDAGATGPQGTKGDRGAQGQPGLSNVITGAGYTSTWKAGEFGETIETCPEGQYAIGGGYSMWGGYGGKHDSYDLGGENTDIQVTVSAPYFKGEYEPVDEAGNFRADQWVVRGFNNGDTDQIVRAWVVCATVAE